VCKSGFIRLVTAFLSPSLACRIYVYIMIRTAIIGASGYTGFELMRMLSYHPRVELVAVTSDQFAGRHPSECFPALKGRALPFFQAHADARLENCDAVFFATPHGTAMHMAPDLLKCGVRVIDLSADFRLPDPDLWKEYYGQEHQAKAWLKNAVYGLTEYVRESLPQAQLVANPGCYPTAVQIGLLPLLREGLIENQHIIVDAKSGISGAGRVLRQQSLFCEANESMNAYGLAGHRHHPEMLTHLKRLSGRSCQLHFVPHLVPMNRGIYATIYVQMASSEGAIAREFLQAQYEDEPFVAIMAQDQTVSIQSVRGSNMVHLGCYGLAGGMAVILVALDNLIKGAAGQAIQNFNLMFGCDETTGLPMIGL